MTLEIVALLLAAFTVGQMFSVMLEWNLHRKDK